MHMFDKSGSYNLHLFVLTSIFQEQYNTEPLRRSTRARKMTSKVQMGLDSHCKASTGGKKVIPKVVQSSEEPQVGQSQHGEGDQPSVIEVSPRKMLLRRVKVKQEALETKVSQRKKAIFDNSEACDRATGDSVPLLDPRLITKDAKLEKVVSGVFDQSEIIAESQSRVFEDVDNVAHNGMSLMKSFLQSADGVSDRSSTRESMEESSPVKTESSSPSSQNAKPVRKREVVSKLERKRLEELTCKRCRLAFIHHSSLQLHRRLHGWLPLRQLVSKCRRRYQISEVFSAHSALRSSEAKRERLTRARSFISEQVEQHQDDSALVRVIARKDGSKVDSYECEMTIAKPLPKPRLVKNIETANSCKENLSKPHLEHRRKWGVSVSRIMKGMQEKSNFQCEICLKHFQLNTLRRLHIVTEHRLQGKRYRPFQYRSLKSAGALNCLVCGRQFKYKSSLVHHWETFHHLSDVSDIDGQGPLGNVPLSCRHCGKVMKYHVALKTHLKLSHGLAPHEIEVEFTEPSRVPLRRRTIGISGSKTSFQFACPICHKGFGKLHLARGHLSRTHGIELVKKPRVYKVKTPALKNKWECSEKCGYVGQSYRQLKGHIEKEHPSVIHQCPLCLYKTRVKFMLDR